MDIIKWPALAMIGVASFSVALTAQSVEASACDVTSATDISCGPGSVNPANPLSPLNPASIYHEPDATDRLTLEVRQQRFLCQLGLSACPASIPRPAAYSTDAYPTGDAYPGTTHRHHRHRRPHRVTQ